MKARAAYFGRGGIGRASLSSFGATTGDYFAFAALLSVGGAAVATFLGCVVGGILNFTVNRLWAFESRGPIVVAAMRYMTVSGSSAVANVALVSVATSGLGLSAPMSWGIARGLVFLGLTYPLFRGWVFAPKTEISIEVTEEKPALVVVLPAP